MADPEALKAYQKNYRIAHKEELESYAKSYYATHLEEKRAYARVWYAAHKEITKDRANARYAAHQNEIKEQVKARYTAHPEEKKAYAKSYRADHVKEIVCIQCGKSATVNVQTSGKFCTQECSAAWHTGANHSNWKGGIYPLEGLKVYAKSYRSDHHEELKAYAKSYRADHVKEIVCIQCGKSVKVSIETSGKFCTKECSEAWHTGANHPNWKGGVSIKYCPKFDEPLREEIRDKFGRCCFLSGLHETSRKLDVHHCDYLKSQGCRGQRWSLLPLTRGWHTKTGANRHYWFCLLRDYWCYKYLTFHGMDIFPGPSRTEWLWEMYESEIVCSTH
jgi:hypothetical protein